MADRYIPEHRRNFKAKGTFKPDELRRRREEQQVEIRKQKREENLAKRRNMAVSSPAPGAGAESDEEGGNESQVRVQKILSTTLLSFLTLFYVFFFCFYVSSRCDSPSFLAYHELVKCHKDRRSRHADWFLGDFFTSRSI